MDDGLIQHIRAPKVYAALEQLNTLLKGSTPSERWSYYRGTLTQTSRTFLMVKFMETFCDPAQYRLPVRDLGAAGYALIQDATLKNFSVTQLCTQINPRRVPASLLKKLGITPELESSGVLKLTPIIVKALLGFFGSLEPLQSFVVSRGKEVKFGITPRYWVIAKMPEIEGDKVDANPLKGSLLRFTSSHIENPEVLEDSTGDNPDKPKETFKEPSLSIYTDLASCLRASGLQRKGSLLELDKLAPLGVRGQTLSDWLWKSAALTPDEKGTLLDQLAELARQAEKAMPAPLANAKRIAKVRLVSSADMKDRLGRPNANATSMKLGAASRNSESRLGDIAGTAQYNEADFFQLARTYKANETFFKVVIGRLDIILRLFGQKPLPMFVEKSKPKDRVAQVDGVFARLGLSPQNLEGFKCRPFYTFASSLEALRAKFKSAVGSDELISKKESDALLAALKSLLILTTDIHPKYLMARHAMNGQQNGVTDGRAHLAGYIIDLINILNLPESVHLFNDVKDQLKIVADVDGDLRVFKVPRRVKPLNYLKSLADKVDLEKILFGQLTN